jgi:rubrerythrin
LTTVAVDLVAVVARLARADVDDQIAARLVRPAVRGTTVARSRVAIVADLGRIDHAIAASDRETHAIPTRASEGGGGERIAIQSYNEIVKWLGNDDPTTRRLMEEILAVEEEHADDLLNLLKKMRD